MQCPEAIESLVLLSSLSTHNLFTFHTPLNTFLFTPLFPLVVFTHLGSHLRPQSYIITVHTRKSQLTTNSPHKGPWSCTAHTRIIKTCHQLAISVRDNYGEKKRREKTFKSYTEMAQKLRSTHARILFLHNEDFFSTENKKQQQKKERKKMAEEKVVLHVLDD